MNNYVRGESIPNILTLSVDPDTLDTIVVTVKHKHHGTQLGVYSLAAGTVTKVGANNQIKIICEASETANVPTGVYEFSVSTGETDEDYEDNARYRGDRDDLFYLKKA